MPKLTNDGPLLDGHAKPKKYEFKLPPWEHQAEALRVSWNKYYFALLMEYGTGKTKVILDTTGILFERNRIDALFIIAPNEVHERWVTEQVPEHLPDRIPYIARVWTGKNTKKFKRSLEDFWKPRYEDHLKIFTMNIEALRMSKRAKAFAKNFLKAFVTLLTIDESTRIKTPSAKGTRYINTHLAPLAEYRRTLTGNQITRSPFDVYSPYVFLKKSFWTGIKNFQVFKNRYAEWKTNFTYRKDVRVKANCPGCQGFVDKINLKRMSGRLFPVCPKCHGVWPEKKLPWQAKQLVESGGKFEYPTLIKYRNMKELRERVSVCSYLVRKSDCMDLPSKVYQPIYTEMNPDQKRLYADFKERMEAEYRGQTVSVMHKIALSTRFQQIIGGFFPDSEEPIGEKNPKIERLLYDLEDVDCDDPIIIWSVFRVELQALAIRLKKEYDSKKVSLFFGDTSKEDRRKIIDSFQQGKVQFLVANPMAAGTGLNLQRSYIHYYYSNSNKAEDRWQSEDRSHRGGQTHTCLYRDIFISGTIDDSIKKANEKKINLAEFFKDKSINELF